MRFGNRFGNANRRCDTAKTTCIFHIIKKCCKKMECVKGGMQEIIVGCLCEVCDGRFNSVILLLLLQVTNFLYPMIGVFYSIIVNLYL